MNQETARNFFMWCTVIDYGLLVLWCLVYKFGRGWHYRLTTLWFPVTQEEYDNLNLRGVAVFKIAILLLNLVPYIALRIAG
jgi:hypothetical protein